MKKNLLFLTFFVFFIATNATAQWMQTGGPAGSNILNTLRASNGDLLTATVSGGMYKSTDNGTSWFSVNNGLIASGKNFTNISALNKGLNGKFYIYTLFNNEKRVFTSSDNGDIWTMLASQAWGGGPTTATSNGMLYQWLGNELAISSNDGTSWLFPTLNGLPKDLIGDFVPVSNTELFIVLKEGKGIYKSSDAGINWSKLTTHPLSPSTAAKLFYNDNVMYLLSGTTIQISTDHGQTWAITYSPPVNPLEPVVICAANNGDIYVAGRIVGVIKSTDKGATWNPFTTGVEVTGVNQGIVTTQSNDVILAQYAFGLYKSPQSAANFKLANNGFRASSVNNFFESKSGTLYVTTDASAFSSTDGGGNWKKLIDFSLTHTSICENDNYIFIGKNDGVMRSANGGANWGFVGNGFTIGGQQYVTKLMVTPKGTILAATGGGMFRTTNNGDAWTKLTVFGTNTEIKSIIQKQNGDLYASANFKFYKSTDDGVSWVQVSLGKLISPATDLDGQINVIDHISDSKNNLYINFGGNFYMKSADNGLNWEKISIPTNGISTQIKTILLGRSDSLFIVTNHNILVTSDYSATHVEINNGLISQTLNGLTKTASGDLYLLTAGSGLMKQNTVKTANNELSIYNDNVKVIKSYPNPFANETKIQFRVINPGFISVKIYNLIGVELADLVSEYYQPGFYETVLNADNLQLKKGVYFCKLLSDGKTTTTKLVYQGN